MFVIIPSIAVIISASSPGPPMMPEITLLNLIVVYSATCTVCIILTRDPVIQLCTVIVAVL